MKLYELRKTDMDFFVFFFLKKGVINHFNDYRFKCSQIESKYLEKLEKVDIRPGIKLYPCLTIINLKFVTDMY